MVRSAKLQGAAVSPVQSRNVFLDDVRSGLRRRPRSLPCKYFYDERGSKLFDRICGLEEYYLTRAELAIMRQSAAHMAAAIGRGALLVEYGSGSSVKTRLLLDHLPLPASYVPVDISREHLEASASRLARSYPHVDVVPVCADFTEDFDLPALARPPARTIVYFPGSTIGNLQRDDADVLLRRIAAQVGPGGGLLIGVDLQKDPATIEAAYNDAQGVTAEFNLNILRRINRELGADFRTDQFRHRAVYSEGRGRVEIGLVSGCEQTVRLAGEVFRFAPGEEIRTEFSHKYTIGGFSEMACPAGFALGRTWTDPLQRFAVLYFTRSA